MGKKFNVDQFENYVNRLIGKTGVPGLGVGLSIDGSLEYFKGFGLADVEKNQPVTKNTVFGLASVTKSFTALAVNMLVEAGKISVSQPVKRYLPEFNLYQPGKAEKILVHNFLTHTSGIPLISARVQKGDFKIEDNKQLIDFIVNNDFRLLGMPGEHVSYSNDCYSLLGELIERVVGISFEAFLGNSLWKPLGMEHTFTGIGRLSDFQIQGKYSYDNGDRLIKIPWSHRDAYASSGAIKSSVGDLLKYMEVYLGKGIVNGIKICESSTIDRMITPYYPMEDGSYYSYGFRIIPEYVDEASVVMHGGNIPGVASYIGFIPEKKIAIAVLSNLSNFPAQDVFFAAVNSSLNLPADNHVSKKPHVQVPHEHLEKISGTYESDEGSRISFELCSKGLVAVFKTEGKDRRYVVKMTGLNSLIIEQESKDTEVFFLFNSLGEVWAMRQGMRLIYKVK